MSVANSYKKKESLDKKCYPHHGDEGAIMSNSLEESVNRMAVKRTKPTLSQHEKLG